MLLIFLVHFLMIRIEFKLWNRVHAITMLGTFYSCFNSGDTPQDLQRLRVLTASIYYVVAKVNGFVLLDVDMLPLQGEHWQTDQMLSAYFCLLTTRFSTPNSLKCNIDFTSVGSIISGTGLQKYLETGHGLPLTSVSKDLTIIFSRDHDYMGIMKLLSIFAGCIQPPRTRWRNFRAVPQRWQPLDPRVHRC